MKYLITILAMCVAVACATSFTDCGSEATDISLFVDGCVDPPCIVERNSTYLISITFSPSHEIEGLTANMTSVIDGEIVPFPDLDSNACANLAEGQSCPLATGVPTTWEYLAPITDAFPQVTTVATVTLVDEHEDHYCVCLEFDVTFV